MAQPYAILALIGLLAVQAPQPLPTQADLDTLARQMAYRFTIIDNRSANCPGGSPPCFVSEIEIKTPATLPDVIAAAPLEIRFGYVSRLISSDSEIFAERLINGDLHMLSIKPGKRLAPGTSYRIRLYGAGHFFSTSYPMPNASISVPGLAPRVIAATRPKIDPETGLETLPFITPMTDEAKLATARDEDKTQWLTPERAYARYAERGTAAPLDVAILPMPQRVTQPAGAPLNVAQGFAISTRGVERTAIRPALAAVLAAGLVERRGGLPLSLEIDARRADIGPGGYTLFAGPKGIAIVGGDAEGVSNGLRSLAQQIAWDRGHLRPIEITDDPRFRFRGVHIDVARNFHSRTMILRLIEQMAAYKLNKLHLHLGDDEGWRLQIAALPELTEIGGYRCLDASEATCLLPQLGADPSRHAATNGYLTQADYIAILEAANERQIEVIPSFDMPGHSRSAIRAMEVRYQRLKAAGRLAEAEKFRLVEPGDTTVYRSIQNYDDNTLNVCLPSTYAFIDTVIDALAAMHKRAGVPLKTYHIGADETAGAWTGSPACLKMMAETGLKPDHLGAHFIERVSNDLAKRGITVAGWSDGMGHTDVATMPKSVQTNIWGGLFSGGVAEAQDQANRGWKTVLSMPDTAYLDMPYAPDPQEPGYDWAAREVSAYKIFAFMPENLPANAETQFDIFARPGTIADSPVLGGSARISGLQAQLWSETVRSDAQAEYMLFPRLLALAERAWHRASWEPAYAAGTSYVAGDGKVDTSLIRSDWQGFASRVAFQFRMLDKVGIAYRLSPPGARIRGGMLEANTEYPSMRVEYRFEGGRWQAFTDSVAVSGSVALRTRSPDGKRASRTVVVSQR